MTIEQIQNVVGNTPLVGLDRLSGDGIETGDPEVVDAIPARVIDLDHRHDAGAVAVGTHCTKQCRSIQISPVATSPILTTSMLDRISIPVASSVRPSDSIMAR